MGAVLRSLKCISEACFRIKNTESGGTKSPASVSMGSDESVNFPCMYQQQGKHEVSTPTSRGIIGVLPGSWSRTAGGKVMPGISTTFWAVTQDSSKFSKVTLKPISKSQEMNHGHTPPIGDRIQVRRGVRGRTTKSSHSENCSCFRRPSISLDFLLTRGVPVAAQRNSLFPLTQLQFLDSRFTFSS